MLETIVSVAQETFSDDELKANVPLEKAKGFDSMAMVQFIMELETAFEIDIDDDQIIKRLTCNDVEALLKNM